MRIAFFDDHGGFSTPRVSVNGTNPDRVITITYQVDGGEIAVFQFDNYNQYSYWCQSISHIKKVAFRIHQAVGIVRLTLEEPEVDKFKREQFESWVGTVKTFTETYEPQRVPYDVKQALTEVEIAFGLPTTFHTDPV